MVNMLFRNGPEYLPLKKILMYRPGDELLSVDSNNYRDYLFKEPVDRDKLVAEYDEYIESLRNLGVEVVLLNDLFRKIGWTPRFIPPNLLFMRDVMAIIEDKVVYGSMRFEIRRMEPIILQYVFKKLGWDYSIEYNYGGYFEGGDLLYLDNKTILIGYGPRTSYEYAYSLAGYINRIGLASILVPLPKFRVHLDGGMMVLDEDLVIAHIPSIKYYPSLVIHSDGEIDVITLYDYLVNDGYTIIGVKDEESMKFGANNVVIRKNLVISYSWNKEAINSMREFGIDVISLEAEEIRKAAGGLHCLFNIIFRG